MMLAIKCRHCGVRRNWQKCSDGCLRPEQSMGPHGVGHYSYACADSPSGRCEPSELEQSPGARMIRDLAERGVRRRKYGRAG